MVYNFKINSFEKSNTYTFNFYKTKSGLCGDSYDSKIHDHEPGG
jgi:hypothetical protein